MPDGPNDRDDAPRTPVPYRPPPAWRRLFGRRVEVRESSMAPALRPGDHLLVDRGAYRRDRPRVGDVVLLVDPEGSRRWLLKRVAPPPEPIGDEQVWLLGDAPEVSRDSRQFGPVALRGLLGRAWYVYAPRFRRGPV